MWRLWLVLTTSLLLTSCSPIGKQTLSQGTGTTSNLDISSYHFDGVNSPTPESTIEKKYPGKMIDEVFPIQFERSFIDKGIDKEVVTTQVDDFELKTRGFTPISLSQHKEEIFYFRPTSYEGYWSNLAGTASLLGRDAKQIYLVATGPGAVCCTNYWIVDVSLKKPRLIFSSEAYGRFRDAMEVFDSDNDGVYELVQFDSCFRYFMEECGTCTPEPRVVFKYDSRYQKYLPAAGIMQDFVKEAMLNTEKDIKEKYEAWKNGKDDNLKFDLHGIVLDHAVQLMHFGKEKEGWRFLKTYDPLYDRKLEKEVQGRLKGCLFFKHLPKIS